MRHSVVASRVVRVGGASKDELRRELELGGVRLNKSGEELFGNPAFTTSTETCLLECVEVAVSELGHSFGATMEAILHSVGKLGLALCPLEVGPHFRLQYTDQPEGFLGYPASQNCAPPGSLTVVSPALSPDHETPKGFYLRKINGELWLRGYRSGPEHVWSVRDRLLLCRPSTYGAVESSQK